MVYTIVGNGIWCCSGMIHGIIVQTKWCFIDSANIVCPVVMTDVFFFPCSLKFSHHQVTGYTQFGGFIPGIPFLQSVSTETVVLVPTFMN